MSNHEPMWKHPETLDGLKEMVDEIHKYGSKLFIQLSAGTGRAFPMPREMYDHYNVLNPKMHLDETLYAPSEGLPNRWINEAKSKEMPVDAIHEMIEGFGEAAYLLKQQGVDGIDVHAVHEGYLLDQFTLPYANHRDDEYGGSLENRLRFACEIVKSIKAKCGEDFPVTLRYSVTSKVRSFNHGIIPEDTESKEIGRTLEESQKAVQILSKAGYDAFNADNGNYDSWYYAHPPVYVPLNTNLKEAMAIKPYTDKAVICAGRMQLDESAQAIREGKLDFIALGRQLLADERYLEKIKQDDLEDVRPCISCHLGCMAIGLWKDSGCKMARVGSCALNPYVFNEEKYAVKQTDSPKNIAIIGAGIAGLEAAIQATKRGHHVTVYEKSDRVAGVFNEAASFTFKEKDRELIEYYKTQIKKENIEIKFNTEITDLDSLDADEIIIATGASSTKTLPIPGVENSVSALDFLKDGMKCEDKVAIIGGGLTGCEIAYDLAKAGKHPYIIEIQDDILKVFGSSMANTSFLRDAFDYYKVPVYVSTKTLSISEKEVVIEAENGEKTTLPVDTTILSVGYNNGIPFDVEGKEHVHVIGDAEHVSNLLNAIEQANDLVLTF